MADKETINGKIGLMELVENYPVAAEILIAEGMHCFGCMAAHFETLEQGLEAHGKSKDEIKTILKKMNDSVKKK